MTLRHCNHSFVFLFSLFLKWTQCDYSRTLPTHSQCVLIHCIILYYIRFAVKMIVDSISSIHTQHSIEQVTRVKKKRPIITLVDCSWLNFCFCMKKITFSQNKQLKLICEFKWFQLTMIDFHFALKLQSK